eukprot:SAG22_NODE_697_length_7825_cov_8.757831_7_plen_50_part_00
MIAAMGVMCRTYVGRGPRDAGASPSLRFHRTVLSAKDRAAVTINLLYIS